MPTFVDPDNPEESLIADKPAGQETSDIETIEANIDRAKGKIVEAIRYRDEVEKGFMEAMPSTYKEWEEWIKKLGRADRQVDHYRGKIRHFYRMRKEAKRDETAK